MKIIYLTILCLLGMNQIQAQKGAARKLTWSVGEATMTRNQEVRVSYPILVAIDDASNTPQLGTSTIRLFYDAGYLDQLTIENIAHGYQVSGLNKSKNVFGDIFGFAGGGGVFAQFNIIANQQDLLDITTEPVPIMEISFIVRPGSRIPLCAPLVLDNNPASWGKGFDQDAGYLTNDAGIVGTYFLANDLWSIQLADDEVKNFLWEKSASFDNLVDQLNDKAGLTIQSKSKACIESKTPINASEWGRFAVKKETKSLVRVDWSTVSEFNNDYFEVERAKDGWQFESIGSIKGQWNTHTETAYHFLDKAPLPGINYYRLKQVDNTGKVEYSTIQQVEMDGDLTAIPADIKVTYYPNPTKGMVRILSEYGFEDFEISVTNVEGRVVLKRDHVDANSVLKLSGLSSGVYTLSLMDRDHQLVTAQQIVLTGE